MIRDHATYKLVFWWAAYYFPHLLIGNLQQVQHDSMGSHVLQEPLLLHTTFLTRITQLTEPLQDLKMRHTNLF